MLGDLKKNWSDLHIRGASLSLDQWSSQMHNRFATVRGGKESKKNKKNKANASGTYNVWNKLRATCTAVQEHVKYTGIRTE